MIEWKKIRSSAIIKVGYDSDRNIMLIDFEGSEPQYTYYQVPKKVFQKFVSAESVGRYYHQNIKDRYVSDSDKGELKENMPEYIFTWGTVKMCTCSF